MSDKTAADAALLAEYTALKAEQVDRIRHRDNLPYVTLLAIAAIVGASIQYRATALILAIPAVSAILGWTRLATDEKVTAIQRYLRTSLAPRLAAAVGATEQPVLGWETQVYTDQRRRLRAGLHLAADLLTFIVPGITAVFVWRANDQPNTATMAAAIAGQVVTGVLAWQIFSNADLSDHTV